MNNFSSKMFFFYFNGFLGGCNDATHVPVDPLSVQTYKNFSKWPLHKQIINQKYCNPYISKCFGISIVFSYTLRVYISMICKFFSGNIFSTYDSHYGIMHNTGPRINFDARRLVLELQLREASLLNPII